MQDSNELLSIDRLTFSYEEDEKPIFKDLSFQIQKGERALLLGPSGCGKSSLALCINGLYPEACDAAQTGRISLFQKTLKIFKLQKSPLYISGWSFKIQTSSFACSRLKMKSLLGWKTCKCPRKK